MTKRPNDIVGGPHPKSAAVKTEKAAKPRDIVAGPHPLVIQAKSGKPKAGANSEAKPADA